MSSEEYRKRSIRLIFRREVEGSGDTWYHAKHTSKASTYGHLQEIYHSYTDGTEEHNVRLIGVAETVQRGHIDDQNNWNTLEEAVEELETNGEVKDYWFLKDRLNEEELEEVEKHELR